MEISDTEETLIIPEEDHGHKIRLLNNLVEEIQTQDEKFYSLVDGVIDGEEQKGKIAAGMKLATLARKRKEQGLYMTLALRTTQIVGNFSEQVEGNKRQKIILKYEEGSSLKNV